MKQRLRNDRFLYYCAAGCRLAVALGEFRYNPSFYRKRRVPSHTTDTLSDISDESDCSFFVVDVGFCVLDRMDLK